MPPRASTNAPNGTPQVAVFGDSTAVGTVVLKVIVDQFIYTPILGVVVIALAYTWREHRFSLRRTFAALGPQIVEWIETYLCHGPGDVSGEPIELDDEFYAFVVKAYRLDPSTGRRAYRRAFLSRAKGRAKSELAGMLVCAEALAPVRFDGWDAQGEPVGRPVKSPYIRCLATEEGQSGNTYDNVSTMMEFLVERHGDAFPGIDIGKSAQTSSRIVLHHQRGEVTPSTASSAAKDGGKETFAVF